MERTKLSTIHVKDEDHPSMQSRKYVDEYLQGLDRETARKKYRDYRLGFSAGRRWQHKCEMKDRTWVYAGIGTLAFAIGVWLGTALTNGTW